MLDDTLLARWSQTLGEDAATSRLSTAATYRQPGWQCRLEFPEQMPRFQPGSLLGQGGMGLVLRARQSSLRREVALKSLKSDPPDALAREHFLAEAILTGRLEHPNIVPVHELDRDPAGRLQLAMKLVEGQSWHASLRERPDALDFHLQVLDQVCNAVAFAHSRGVVHNDLKPSNVMLGAFGEVLLMDWGLAVECGPRNEHTLRHKSSIHGPCGTPEYIAPELAQGDGDAVSPATDVYLLGGILYRILAGHPPHQGEGFLATLVCALRGEIPPLDPDVPTALRRLVEQALQQDPERRPSDAQAFQAGLRLWLQHRESLRISQRAAARLQRCRDAEGAETDELYEDLAEVVASFAEARRVWAENPQADQGIVAARRAYAQAALANGDLGLAAAQLERLRQLPAEDCWQDLEEQLARLRARKRRVQRNHRSLRFSLLALAALSLLGVLGGWWWERVRAGQVETRERAAIEALEDLSGGVHTFLLEEASDERTAAAARQVARVALNGWLRLYELRVREDRLSSGTAQARLMVARNLMAAGLDLERTQQELRLAIEAFDRLAQDPDEAWSGLADGCDARLHLAIAQMRAGRVSDAQSALLEARDLGQELLRRFPDKRRGLVLAIEISRRLAENARSREDLAEARSHLLEAVERARILASSKRTAQLQESDVSIVVNCLWTLAGTERRLGQLEASRSALAEAAERCATLDGGALSTRLLHARVQAELAEVLARQGNLEQADLARQQSLTLLRASLAVYPSSNELRSRLARTLDDLAHQLVLRDPAAAAAARTEALELQRTLALLHPQQPRFQEALSTGLANAVHEDIQRGQYARARRRLEEVLQLEARMFQDSTNLLLRRNHALLLHSRGEILQAEGRLEEARQVYAQALAQLQTLAALEPDNDRLRRDVMLSWYHLGELAQHRGNDQEALSCFRERLRLSAILARADSTDLRAAHDRANAALNLAGAYFDCGLSDSGRVGLRDARTRYTALLQRYPELLDVRANLCSGLMLEARLLARSGGDAWSCLQLAQTELEALLARAPDYLQARLHYAELPERRAELLQELSPVEALPEAQEARTRFERIAASLPGLPEVELSVCRTLELEAELLTALERADEGLEACDRAYQLRARLLTGADTPGRRVELQANRLLAGELWLMSGDSERAVMIWGDVLTEVRALVRHPPARVRARWLLARVCDALADELPSQTLGAEGLAAWRELMSRQPHSLEVVQKLVSSLHRQAALLQAAEPEARTLLEEAVGLSLRLWERARPDQLEMRRCACLSLERLGDALAAAGDLAGARACHEQALSYSRRLLAAHPDRPICLRGVYVSQIKAAECARALGALDEAEPLYRAALAGIEAFVASAHDALQGLRDRFATHYNLRDLAVARGDLEQARTDSQAALEAAAALRALGSDAIPLAHSRAALSQHILLLELLGDNAAALQAAEQMLQLSPTAWDWLCRARLRTLLGDAEGGRDDAARALREKPDAYLALWLAGLGGDPAPLRDYAGDNWPGPLARLFLGELDETTLLAAAAQGDPATQAGQLCEAYGYLGLWAERAGRRAEALEHYRACLATGVEDYVEYRWARARLRQTEADR